MPTCPAFRQAAAPVEAQPEPDACPVPADTYAPRGHRFSSGDWSVAPSGTVSSHIGKERFDIARMIGFVKTVDQQPIWDANLIANAPALFRALEDIVLSLQKSEPLDARYLPAAIRALRRANSVKVFED